ncbi:MAG TPA: hypothetical protein V6C72_17250, partial [Chroococcales cyanobacterium]
MRFQRLGSIAISTTLLAGALAGAAVAKRAYTITERQEKLQREITKDERSKELTKKEADGLRQDLQDITNRIAKMKEKNGGKLSYKDEGKIEKSLNGVSLKLK